MTEAPTTLTRGQAVAADITALLRARNPLLWIVTREEARVERYLFEAAAAAGYVSHTWDCAAGVCDMAGKSERINGMGGDVTINCDVTLSLVRDIAASPGATSRNVWIMRDLPSWLQGPMGTSVVRQLRNLARSLPAAPRSSAQAIIVLTPSPDVPPELAGHATVIEWPMPDRTEIAAILDAAIGSLPDEMRETAAPNGSRDLAIDSAVGLSGEEASACYARSLVQLRRIDPAAVASEKKRVIARERVLEWYDPIPGGLDAVGGLELLKAWLVSRKSAYSPAARAYGLPAPKGALFVGISGCGKSLLAKATATAWQVPLLRVDLSALRSKFVGESEANLRKSIATIEAVGRCVVWIDEVEKALQGATSGSADGGVSADALGTILTWMQERTGEAFVIATANDVSALPPELLRKGRFDELWFVDLPTPTERAAILAAALRAHGRAGAEIQLDRVAAATEGFTGSEIAALVPDALYVAFADDAREISTSDLLEVSETIVPLSRTADKKIADLRAWAEGRARRASAPESAAPAQTAGRQLDF
jgi:hypothetical protein